MRKSTIIVSLIAACLTAAAVAHADEAEPGEALARAIAQAQAQERQKVKIGVPVVVPADKLFDGDTFIDEVTVTATKPGRIDEKGGLVIDSKIKGRYDITVEARLGKMLLADKVVKVEFVEP